MPGPVASPRPSVGRGGRRSSKGGACGAGIPDKKLLVMACKLFELGYPEDRVEAAIARCSKLEEALQFLSRDGTPEPAASAAGGRLPLSPASPAARAAGVTPPGQPSSSTPVRRHSRKRPREEAGPEDWAPQKPKRGRLPVGQERQEQPQELEEVVPPPPPAVAAAPAVEPTGLQLGEGTEAVPPPPPPPPASLPAPPPAPPLAAAAASAAMAAASPAAAASAAPAAASVPAEQPEGLQVSVGLEECTLCFSEVRGALRLSCRHGWYCVQCIVRHAEARLADGAVDVPCPQCRVSIPERDLKELLPPEIGERLQARSLAHAVSKTADLRHCPTPDCPMVVALEEGGELRFRCPLCRRTSCLGCGAQPFHRGLTCEAFAEKRSNKAEETFRRWMQETGTPQCPTCGMAVTKENLDRQTTQYQECHKMMCRNCSTRFCFKCEKVLTEKFSCGCSAAAHQFIDPVTRRPVPHLKRGRGRGGGTSRGRAAAPAARSARGRGNGGR